MTVKEFIKYLETLPGDAKVKVLGVDNYMYEKVVKYVDIDFKKFYGNCYFDVSGKILYMGEEE